MLRIILETAEDGLYLLLEAMRYILFDMLEAVADGLCLLEDVSDAEGSTLYTGGRELCVRFVGG